MKENKPEDNDVLYYTRTYGGDIVSYDRSQLT